MSIEPRLIVERCIEFLCGIFTGHTDSVVVWTRGWPLERRERVCRKCGKVLPL